MSWLRGLQAAGSGIIASSVRMSVIAENLANAEATRTVEGGPYRRQVVVLSSMAEGERWFGPEAFKRAIWGGGGPCRVQVWGITAARQPTKMVYKPDHPDANAAGYVEMPNVDVPMEMADLTVASRVYEANVAALQVLRAALNEALSLLA